ncbi:DUF4339 domain-containing protein [Gimesia sp.]|uniref:DUF4339 domain-containing protein n=1 Tax=Gimesia sp. TaxID=2024833 RepID=UPI000C462FC4|nr:DUF4339 domain-containing protein [Gimesia sp.]MAX38913.1 hypothetical protein [Gimesia sp.]HAH46033.1 hypothetical protein [Planctomycetaceae bacterium]HBL42761.1 hypothetical protein [Planctomycetaceae bacterium]|tara:strand:+ start:1772 stop:2863 length:1092 start_codon:yes stop_codon:yes gene_type:complete
MATEWYCKRSDEELGPYTFRELVEMIREEQLAPETQVRPHYLDDWQRADSVVGLYYMARRDPDTIPVSAGINAEPPGDTADLEDLDAFLSDSVEPGTDSEPRTDQPGWLRRLLSLRNSKIPPVPIHSEQEAGMSASATDSVLAENPNLPPGETAEEQSDEAETGAYSDEVWSTTVKAAVDRVDERAPQQEELPPPRQNVLNIRFSFLSGALVKRALFVLVLILCVSAGTVGVVNWLGEGQFYFPFVGPVSPLLFLLYTSGALLTIAIITPLLFLISASYLRLGYKLLTAGVMTTAAAWFLLNWKEQHNQIFPSREPTEAKLLFPLIGECSEFSYWMYFADVVIFVAVLTYLTAWFLESRADEV